MTKDEFVSALADTPISLDVVLHHPKDDAALQDQIRRLENENYELKQRVDSLAGCIAENIGLRSRLKSARRVLLMHGISAKFLDDI